MASATTHRWSNLPYEISSQIIRDAVYANPRIIPVEADFGTAEQFFVRRHPSRKAVPRSSLTHSHHTKLDKLHGVDTISIDEAKSADVFEKAPVQFTSAAPVPALLHVSREFRREAMKYYVLGFTETGRLRTSRSSVHFNRDARPIYWNPEIDTIYFWHRHLFTEAAFEGLSLSMLQYALRNHGGSPEMIDPRYSNSTVEIQTTSIIQNLAIDMKALKFNSEGDFKNVNLALHTTEDALLKFTSLKKLTLVAFASDVQEIARRDIGKLIFSDPSAELDLLEIQDYRENYEGKEDSMQDAIDSMVGDLDRCELEVKCLGEKGDFARYEDCEVDEKEQSNFARYEDCEVDEEEDYEVDEEEDC